MELKECVLYLVGLLGENAYPARITTEFSKRAGRSVPVAAIHYLLDRFEREGVLVSSLKEVHGKSTWRKRVYAITEYGRQTKHVPVFKETLNEMLNVHLSPRLTHP